MFEQRGDGAEPPDGRRIRVGILDRHQLVRDALAAWLDPETFEVAIGTTRPDALLAAIESWQLDVVLMEVELAEPVREAGSFAAPDAEAGLRAVELIAERAPQVPIVVLTGCEDPEVLARCYRLGVKAYLSKRDVGLGALAGALRAVHRGERILSAQPTPPITEPTPPRDPLAGLELLTAREREVLALVAAGQDNLKIAATLGIAERTAKSHIAELYRKIGVENRVQMAIRGRALGLLRRS